jgi:flagellar biosynthesis protein FlhA
VIINFIVITKGAGRVAEVGARFTLDAMPGKQMAIDADLNAGIISEADAQKRRQEITREADFYGSMDGASKFVRGDAIAGILIVAINVIGGMIVGVVQNDLSVGDAARIFTLLTVGDGLLAQIPALIVSTAAGIVVTRAASGKNLGDDLAAQIRVHPKALFIAAGIMAFIGIFTGLPAMPFTGVAAFMAFFAYRIKQKVEQEETAALVAEQEGEVENRSEKIEDLLSMDALELEVGYGLIPIVDTDQGGELLDRITSIRKQFAMDMGVIVPPVRIRDNLELNPGVYNVLINGVKVAHGDLLLDHLLAMDPGDVAENIDGVPTTEPVFGLPAVWIVPRQKEEATMNGYTVVDLSTIVATHMTETLRANLHELLGRQEVSSLIDHLKERYPKVVEDLIPNQLSLSTVLRVLKNLVKEGVSIRDLKTILETLAEKADQSKDPDILTEYVRTSLYRLITKQIQNEEGEVHLWTLERGLEESLSQNLIQTDQGPQLSLEPDRVQSLIHAVNEQMEKGAQMGENFVILCSPVIRTHFKKLLDRFVPGVTVISHNELASDVEIKSMGQVRLANAG